MAQVAVRPDGYCAGSQKSIEAVERGMGDGDIPRQRRLLRAPHGKDSVNFINRVSMWFSMNTPLKFKTWDMATKHRLTPFPFNETFHNPGCAPEGGQEKDLTLKPWLESKEGQEALGAYLVEGAIEYYRLNGGVAGDFPNSAAMEELRDKILDASNPYSEFFEECLVFSPDHDTLRPAMNAAVRDFYGRREQKTYERDTFKRALEGKGVVEKCIKGTYYLRGVTFTARGFNLAAAAGHKAASIRTKPVLAVVPAE